jgi:hypothetical protein
LSSAPSLTVGARAAVRERILLLVLFVTVLTSSIAFIEPSPHDVLMGALALACMVAGVRFPRLLLLPLVLLIMWSVAGMLSLLNVPDDDKAIQYTGTSVYLAVAATMFASLFAEGNMLRLATMRVAYVSTAVIAASLGIAGYFGLFPGAEALFTYLGRAQGAFKDPNVYGPFLIWPILIVLQRSLSRRIHPTDLVVAGVLLFGLFLSFSRGAWFHFGVSCAVMLALEFLTLPTLRARARLFLMSAAGLVLLFALIPVLLSFSSIGDMFGERAQLLQSYDVGAGGRFRLQELALGAVLDFPNGMGPFGFANVHGQQQHNVYLQASLVYGWVGAMAYITLVLATLAAGLRTALVRTPWQPYLITAFAAFFGEVLEGFVIDTDHWRHFFLLLGLVWGLAAATVRFVRESAAPPEATFAPAARTVR